MEALVMKETHRVDNLDRSESVKYRRASNRYCAVLFSLFSLGCFGLLVLSGASLLVDVLDKASIAVQDVVLPVGFLFGAVVFAYAARASWTTNKCIDRCK